jgi:prevent-host-death family protein
MESPNHRGAISELAISLAAARLGLEVYKPLSEHARADLVIAIGGQLLRIQCKTVARRDRVLVISTTSKWYAPEGYVSRTYSATEIDAVAAYDHERDRCYLLPIDLVAGMRAISLRVDPPRNGQRAGLHFATDYEFPGAVAQLGERAAGSRKVVGSSPISSTVTNPETADVDTETVGAHEFRNRFGWYMERAAAGEEIHVSRHGSPYVRLLPASI